MFKKICFTFIFFAVEVTTYAQFNLNDPIHSIIGSDCKVKRLEGRTLKCDSAYHFMDYHIVKEKNLVSFCKGMSKADSLNWIEVIDRNPTPKFQINNNNMIFVFDKSNSNESSLFFRRSLGGKPSPADEKIILEK